MDNYNSPPVVEAAKKKPTFSKNKPRPQQQQPRYASKSLDRRRKTQSRASSSGFNGDVETSTTELSSAEGHKMRKANSKSLGVLSTIQSRGNINEDDLLFESVSSSSPSSHLRSSGEKSPVENLDNSNVMEQLQRQQTTLTLPTTTNGVSSRLSTAYSTISTANYSQVQLKTQVTLKSPFEGSNLGPVPFPHDQFLDNSLKEMSHGDWEVNVKGMTGVLRMSRHQPDYLIVEYKQLIALTLKHVKNLRSQVSCN